MMSNSHRRGDVTLLALVATLLIISCGPGSVFEGGISIRGSVTAMIPSTGNDNLGFLRIEGDKEADTQYDRADVAITPSTRLFRRRGSERAPVPFDSLRVGVRVEAKFTGPVMESYPVRANASEITVIE